ncbi:CTP synthase, partial [hydrothermal vent metagenome]
LLEAGIQPHIIACRATNPVQRQVMEKIAMFSNVPLRRVFSMHDRPSIYTIPDEMRLNGLDREILSLLGLHDRVDVAGEDKARAHWGTFVRRLTRPDKLPLTIGVIGKYSELRDAYASIDKALEHAGAHLGANIEQRWIEASEVEDGNAAEMLAGLDGVIVPGGFGSRGVEGKIASVRYCREQGVPYLGICLGFQVAVIEFVRNVLRLEDAASAEFEPDCPRPVISELPDQKKIEGLGGTMRLGAQDVIVQQGTILAAIFRDQLSKQHTIRERFRHRYEVDPTFIERLEAGGLIFSGRHPSQPIMQMLELPRTLPSHHTAGENKPKVVHPYFVGAQFHPELTSRPLRPQPMFMGLVAAALQQRYSQDADTWPRLEADPVVGRWLRELQCAGQLA